MAELESVVHKLSKAKKVVIFCIITFVMWNAFVFYSVPSAFLPIYDEIHGVSSIWTGILLGAGPLSYIFVCPLSALLLNNVSNRILYIVPTVALGILIMLFSTLDWVPNALTYESCGLVMRCTQGIFGGVISVTSFAALVAIYPNNVATVTALAETAVNGALAAGPFIGGVLYTWGGFQLAFFVPGAFMLLSVIPELFIPQLTSCGASADFKSLRTLIDPWVLFAAWHCVSCQILLNYHVPIMSPYVFRVFGENVVWSGMALMVNAGSICISAPFLGFIIDKYNPYIFLIISSICLPICYMLLGPLPLLGLYGTTKAQLLIVLAVLGFFIPMGCTPVLLVMFDVYKLKHGGVLPQTVANVIVSLYCACFPFGTFLGVTISGIVADYADFEWSTGCVSLIYMIQSVACLVYCALVLRMRRRAHDPDYCEDTPIMQSEICAAGAYPYRSID